jgi:hypothetical protein
MKHDLPQPTYWPFFFALSITTLAWGLILNWIVCLVGGVVLFASTIGWMKEVSK